MDFILYENLGIALGLGLLVGLQRQYVGKRLAGIRTFPLITLLGTICGMLSLKIGFLIVPMGLLAVTLLLGLDKYLLSRYQENDPGATTEVAALVMYGVGAALVFELRPVAVVLAGGVTLLLQFKQPMHRFVEQVGETDIRAIMQFILISLVILPILPNQTYGPYQVLNPFKLWLMVVLIVAINLGGYLTSKIVGASGTLLTGILGGLVSSTATTVSYAQRGRAKSASAEVVALVAMLAGTVVFVRVVLELAAVAPGSILPMSLPFGALGVFSLLVCGWAYRRTEAQSHALPAATNPAHLKAALIFALMYAVIALVVAAANDWLGERGLYFVAIISGTTDVDAVTLSAGQMVHLGHISPATGWRTAMTGVLANLVFKAILAGVLGGKTVFWAISKLFFPVFLAGLLILGFWPV